MNSSIPPDAPARYFPVRGSRYDVAPGLRPFATDFGNGDADARVFQIDRRFRRFRRNKLHCRRERLSKYVCEEGLGPEVAAATARFVAARLAEEYPDRFCWDGGRRPSFHSRLTGETLHFDADMRVTAIRARVAPGYASAWDALACQLQEDLAVTRVTAERGDWLAALHVCAASHWAPEEKIGRAFAAVHAPVPGMAGLFPAAASLVEATIRRGPWVRFVWGISGDDRLNHHPEPPPGIAPGTWNGPTFRPRGRPPAFFRVERQVLWGIPEVGAALFVIAPTYVPLSDLSPEQRAQLGEAILGMSPESRAYKGLATCFEELTDYLVGKKHAPDGGA